MSDLMKGFHNPNAHVGHSVFDLSCRRVFSSKAGQLIPALVLDTVPSDKFEINMQALMRSNTLNTPAFVRGKFNYDFFFVPYIQLWHRFNDFVTQKRDLHTSYFRGDDAIYTPSIKLRDLISSLLAVYKDENHDYASWENDIGGHFFSSYANKTYIHENFRLLNMLGYGNFEYLLGLADLDLEYELDCLCGDGSTSNPYIYINPFRLLAYQHIWYDIYRNKYFDIDRFNIPGKSYPAYFNADDVDCSSLGNSRIWTNSIPDIDERMVYMTCLHYCQYKKDIYTSLLPSQQFGVVSTVDLIANSVINSLLPSTGNVRVLSYNQSGELKASQNVSASSPLFGGIGMNAVSANIKSSFDVISLRRAEAMQRWKEAAIRAGNMNDKNQKAHFGVGPYYYEDNNVHFLGSFDGTFQINPIEATANSVSGSNKSVGDIAATGTSVVSDGLTIRFDCRDYGVIMCIERFVPESEYSATGIERSNQRFEPFDYYQPEFAHLGLQAVPLIEQDNSSVVYSDKNFVLGYAPRDYDYKQMQDKVYGEFMTYMSLSESDVNGSFAPWVAPRRDSLVGINQGAPNGRGIDSFYVHPNIFDSVFKAAADASQLTDQFVHQCWFNIKAVRPMPVLGLPEF